MLMEQQPKDQEELTPAAKSTQKSFTLKFPELYGFHLCFDRHFEPSLRPDSPPVLASPSSRQLLSTLLHKHRLHANENQSLQLHLEYSIHACPPRFHRELTSVFPEIFTAEFLMKSAPRELARDLLIVPTFQRTESNMLGFTEDTEKEKDHKLEMFYLWAMSACMQLRKRGFWADFTDPCSGYPMLGPSGSQVYPDVHGAQKLLNYDILNSGCCSVLSHPKWGTSVYPATMFTRAPQEVLQAVLDGMKHSPSLNAKVDNHSISEASNQGS